jgi:hypothetical protein
MSTTDNAQPPLIIAIMICLPELITYSGKSGFMKSVFSLKMFEKVSLFLGSQNSLQYLYSKAFDYLP